MPLTTTPKRFDKIAYINGKAIAALNSKKLPLTASLTGLINLTAILRN